MLKRIYLCSYALLFLTVPVLAVGPNQVALIVNDESDASKMIANAYCALRKIPMQNVVYLEDLPEGAMNSPYRIDVSEFRSSIYNPVRTALRERGLDHVSTWLYSVDFPVKVRTGSTADLSIHGITFTRGIVPSSDVVKMGKYESSLFGGPKPGSGVVEAAVTFDKSLRVGDESNPIPSMSLGFVGDRGNTQKDVVLCLKRGVQADASHPKGTVYFIENNDVRTKCRKWQFLPTQKILSQLKMRSVITTNLPENDPAILGVTDGRMHINPKGYGKYVPGAMGEHLTSAGAVFEEEGHTKCTAWIEAGATASSGAVTEPYALWAKFPAATFFVYYAQGCSIIESFFQSVRCPLQLYMVGEPLAAPWRKGFSVTVVALEDGPFSGTVEFFSRLMPAAPPGVGISYSAFIDDQQVFHSPAQSMVEVDTRTLSDGYHTLRLVAGFGVNVVAQSFDELDFAVNNKGHSVSLMGITQKENLKLEEEYTVTVKASKNPERVGIWNGSKVLHERSWDPPVELTVVPKELGAGPCKIQAYAIYDDGSKVFSKKTSVNVRK